MNKILLFFLTLLLIDCSSVDPNEAVGLWKLEKSTLDAFEQPVASLFLQINSNNSFSVSRQKGDLTGLFEISQSHVTFHSQDKAWFNQQWKFKSIGDHLILQEHSYPLRGRRLSFRKVEKLPRFDAFAKQIWGEWELFKIRANSTISTSSQLTFHIDKSGNYSIYDDKVLQESGSVEVDARHHKITFQNDKTTWNAWFFGRELRLQNDLLGIQYSLRRPEI